VAVALITDGLQLALGTLGPISWFFLDDVLDVIAMLLTTLSLGFHPLLLPTFVIKLLPLADMLPTWTGCVGAVILLRKRAQNQPPPVPALGDAPQPPVTFHDAAQSSVPRKEA